MRSRRIRIEAPSSSQRPNDLFVNPASRSGGVGAALFDASLAYASARGYARLDWVTAQDNGAAQRFYDRHGGRRGPWVSYSATPTARVEL